MWAFITKFSWQGKASEANSEYGSVSQFPVDNSPALLHPSSAAGNVRWPLLPPVTAASARQRIYQSSLTEISQITPALPGIYCLLPVKIVEFFTNLASNTIRIQNLPGRSYSSTGIKIKSKFCWEIRSYLLTATDSPFPTTLCNHLTSPWHNLWWFLQTIRIAVLCMAGASCSCQCCLHLFLTRTDSYFCGFLKNYSQLSAEIDLTSRCAAVFYWLEKTEAGIGSLSWSRLNLEDVDWIQRKMRLSVWGEFPNIISHISYLQIKYFTLPETLRIH